MEKEKKTVGKSKISLKIKMKDKGDYLVYLEDSKDMVTQIRQWISPVYTIQMARRTHTSRALPKEELCCPAF